MFTLQLNLNKFVGGNVPVEQNTIRANDGIVQMLKGTFYTYYSVGKYMPFSLTPPQLGPGVNLLALYQFELGSYTNNYSRHLKGLVEEAAMLGGIINIIFMLIGYTFGEASEFNFVLNAIENLYQV